jgi:hypothetical protein
VRNGYRPGAEAPRPARDRINGRSPGSRVVARHRLPGLTQWLCGSGSPLTVAGAAVALEPAFRTTFPLRSRSRDRRSGALNGRGPPFVNACVPGAPNPKFAHTVGQARPPTSGSKGALESCSCWWSFDSEVRTRSCLERAFTPGFRRAMGWRTSESGHDCCDPSGAGYSRSIVGSRLPAGRKRERGDGCSPEAAAAPATVSGERSSTCH